MKKVRMICGLLLVTICVLGWLSVWRDKTARQSVYAGYLAQAREQESRGLHQKAAENYRAALSIRQDTGTLRELLEVTRSGVAEGVLSRGDYQSVLRELCAREPQDTALWEELLGNLLDVQDYSAARSVLGDMAKVGVSTPRLTELADQVNYSYTTKGRAFTEVFPSASGYTVVRVQDRWGMLAPDGETCYDWDYAYIGPFGEQPLVLLRTQTVSQIVDTSGVVQAKVERRDVIARGAGSGRMPLGGEEGWRYFDIAQGEEGGELYQDASSFQNGVALVKQDARWSFLDTSDQLTNAGFQDVKLYSDGSYCLEDRMVASRDGYRIFTAAGEPVGDLSAADMDVYMGGWIAFQDTDGLWGFVDRDGQVVVEPTYQKAKSFSHGLAAVYDGQYWGFINEAGRWVIPAQYTDTAYFTAKGVCLVDDGSGYRCITLRFP